jgi:NAD+ kinase
MKCIAVYARPVKDNHPDYVKTLSTKLNKAGVELMIHETYYQFLREHYQFNLELPTCKEYTCIKGKVDAIISLGGDGTILETLDLVRESGIPVLGVNTGRLGFLASVYKEDFSAAIDKLLGGQYQLDQRNLLELVQPESVFNRLPFAVNELTLIKKDSSAMISIDTFINDEYLNTYWADGLIVSSPTGSTAYSLSCGGPILVPDSHTWVITPIAPHNLNVRPVVLPDHHTIKLKVKGRNYKCLLSLDSRSAILENETEIIIRKAPFTFNLINIDGQSFFNTLRNKLLWGLDKRN